MSSESSIKIIDSHFHLWYCPGQLYVWPTSDMSIGQPHSIVDYENAIGGTGVTGGVFVQALNNSPAELDWVWTLAKQHANIRGIVAGLDITDPMLHEKLSDYKAKYGRLLVGVRHILDFESEPSLWLESGGVAKGIAILQQHNLTFDLLLRPPLIKAATNLAQRFPHMKFVVNHAAKPYIKDRVIDQWKRDITTLSECLNVYCKVSGLVTEADYENRRPTAEYILPYVQEVARLFGPNRLMFGSDWPVCRLAGFDHKEMQDLANQLLAMCGFNRKEVERIFYDNAIAFYNIKED